MINMFVPVSCLVWYFWGQRRSKRGFIVDAPIVALLIDPTEILNADHAVESELAHLSYSTRRDERLGRIHLKTNDAGNPALRLTLDPRHTRYTGYNTSN